MLYGLRLEANLQEYQGKLENIENYLDSIAEQKNELNKIFYKKYSRLFRKALGLSEDYIDDKYYIILMPKLYFILLLHLR